MANRKYKFEKLKAQIKLLLETVGNHKGKLYYLEIIYKINDLDSS